MSSRKRVLFFVAFAMAALLGGGWSYYCHEYPYGWSHSCDLQLISALRQYAEEHGGAFPAGGATPEASLSLLHPEYANHCVLQGKTVPLGRVQEILESGQPLGPDTCGWYYVEGLWLSDDKRLAICWDKVGLGHNGQRLPDGGHWVLFIDGQKDYIPGWKWPAFLQGQAKLLAARQK